ncbi:MAG: hypothetical protein WCH57_06110 [Verrucomicrobiota bacterium]
MYFFRKLIFSLIFLGAAPGLALANLIVNGGFENAPLQNSGDNPKGVNFGGTAYYANSVPVSLNGWTFGYDGTLDNYGGIAEVEWYSDPLKRSWNQMPADGNFAVELNSDAFRGRMYAQASLNDKLLVGQAYTLTFNLAPELGVTSLGKVSAVISIDGVEYTKTVEALSGWTAETITFVATSESPVIRFYDGIYGSGLNTNFYNDINLDDVTLIPPPQTPEPSAFFALAALITCMGGKWGWEKLARHPLSAKRLPARGKSEDIARGSNAEKSEKGPEL